MEHRFLAFDLETAKDVPGADFNWRAHRPLGISCAATLASDEDQPRLWHGKTADGQPSSRMTQDDARELVRFLAEMAGKGYAVLTWNGLAFDFDLLAEESGVHAECRECALGHVDMMFQVFCSLGYPVGLEKAAQGMGLPGKAAGMSGVEAPRLWAEGKHAQVLEYVAQDVRMAMQIARACERQRRIDWITRKGTKSSMPLKNGWLTVRECLKLPTPDTSWMVKPMRREEFVGWIVQLEGTDSPAGDSDSNGVDRLRPRV